MLRFVILSLFLAITSQASQSKKCPVPGNGLGKNLSPPKIIVFVSLSMPESSLKSLSEEANKHGAVLVMRGLHEDSFTKTSQKLQELGITVDINPQLFEDHHIDAVPTFLSTACGKEVHRLKGNVTLSYCAEQFRSAS